MSNKVQMKTVEKSLDIMIFIVDHFIRYKMSPTVREIQEHFSISSTSVTNHYLDLLEEAGYISRKYKFARGINVPMKCEYNGPELTVYALHDRLAQMKMELEET